MREINESFLQPFCLFYFISSIHHLPRNFGGFLSCDFAIPPVPQKKSNNNKTCKTSTVVSANVLQTLAIISDTLGFCDNRTLIETEYKTGIPKIQSYSKWQTATFKKTQAAFRLNFTLWSWKAAKSDTVESFQYSPRRSQNFLAELASRTEMTIS